MTDNAPRSSAESAPLVGEATISELLGVIDEKVVGLEPEPDGVYRGQRRRSFESQSTRDGETYSLLVAQVPAQVSRNGEVAYVSKVLAYPEGEGGAPTHHYYFLPTTSGVELVGYVSDPLVPEWTKDEADILAPEGQGLAADVDRLIEFADRRRAQRRDEERRLGLGGVSEDNAQELLSLVQLGRSYDYRPRRSWLWTLRDVIWRLRGGR